MFQQLFITVKVFSAHAEVVPHRKTPNPKAGGILRARGGSSTVKEVFSGFFVYSPRTRR